LAQTADRAMAADGAPLVALVPDVSEVDARRQALVDQVKSNQRSSVSFKGNWRGYCDKYGRGFYDPTRHTTEYLEAFFTAAVRGDLSACGGGFGLTAGDDARGRDRSCSWRPREASSPECSHSRCRRRTRRDHRRGSKGRRRRRHRGREGRRHRGRGAKGRKRNRCHRNRRHLEPSSWESDEDEEGEEVESSSAISGLPSRGDAIKSADAAVKEATRKLEKARAQAITDAAETLRKTEESTQEEAAQATEKARSEAEDDLREKLRDAEEKLAAEKVTRMREAEQKLDKAIEERLREAEKRMRPEVEVRVTEAQREAQARLRMFSSMVLPRAHAEAATRVEVAAAKLKAAQARVAELRVAREAANKKRQRCSSRSCCGAAGQDDGCDSTGVAAVVLSSSGSRSRSSSDVD